MLPLALGLFVVGGAAGEATAVGLYRFVDLGEGSVSGLNNRGDYTINTSAGGFVSIGGIRTAVGGAAYGLNDLGQVVRGGGMTPGGSSFNGAIWENGSITQTLDFRPSKINNRGDVIGTQFMSVQNGPLYYFYERGLVRWGSTGVTVDLMTGTDLDDYNSPTYLEGELTYLPKDINNQGVIAGAMRFQDKSSIFADPPYSWGFFIRADGSVYQQAPINGFDPQSEYNAIGEGLRYAGTLHGDEYGRAPSAFGSVPGTIVTDTRGTYSNGLDVNQANQILATRSTGFGPSIPSGVYLWDQQWYYMPDLLTSDSMPGYQLDTPVALNDLGQVIGYSRVNGQYRSWMLTPLDAPAPPVVPEPGTIVLAMAACPVALLWMRRKKKRAGADS